MPVLSAGVREGKNDVNAHVRYFGVGIDLRTEQPKPEKIRRAVDQLLADQSVKANVTRLATELRSYDPNAIITEHLFEAKAHPRHSSADPTRTPVDPHAPARALQGIDQPNSSQRPLLAK